MLRSVAGPYLWQETAWMWGERDRETKRNRVEERKRRERRVVCKCTQWRDHIQGRGTQLY